MCVGGTTVGAIEQSLRPVGRSTAPRILYLQSKIVDQGKMMPSIGSRRLTFAPGCTFWERKLNTTTTFGHRNLASRCPRRIACSEKYHWRRKIPSCLSGTESDNSSPFSGSREEWSKGEQFDSTPESNCSPSDHSSRPAPPPSPAPPGVQYSGPFSALRSEFSEPGNVSGLSSSGSGFRYGRRSRPQPPSPMTITRALRYFVKLGIRLVNQVLLPALYVLSLAWHDFKIRATAPPVPEGESKFFLPEPNRRRANSYGGVGRDGRQSASREEGEQFNSFENENLSKEELQAKLLQDTAISAVGTVRDTAKNTLGALNDLFGFGLGIGDEFEEKWAKTDADGDNY